MRSSALNFKRGYSILLVAFTLVSFLITIVQCDETNSDIAMVPEELASYATPAPLPQAICTYGNTGAHTGKLISQAIRLSVLNVVTLVGVTILVGCLLYIFFSLPSFIFAHAMACIFVNMICLRWETWKWFGPGEGYIENVSSNRLVFIQHAILASINKAFHLMGAAVGARYSFLVEADRVKKRWLTAVRVGFGVTAALAMSAFSTYWSFTRGVPSFYHGSMSDSVNPAGCSGPMPWTDLSGYVRFSEMLILLTALAFYLPYVGGVFAVAGITCSSITIAKSQWSTYHKIVAVGNLFVLVPALFLFIVMPRKQAPASAPISQSEMETVEDRQF